jgi:hypothetical protein
VATPVSRSSARKSSCESARLLRQAETAQGLQSRDRLRSDCVGGKLFRSDVHMNGRQSSVSGIFELKIDNPRSRDLTGTAKTNSPQRVRPVADADEKEAKLDAPFSRCAKVDLVFASSQRVKCQMPCSRMEPQGCERHRWVELRGRNERERVSQTFRSLSATHLPRAHDIGAAFHFAVCSPGSLASFRHASSLSESMNRSLDVFRFRGPITNADPDHRFAAPC